MSFTRIKPGNWAVNEKLTSAQMNAIDVDHANALDKSVAGDTIQGAVGIASGASISANTPGAQILASASGAAILATASGAVVGANITGASVAVSGGANMVAPATTNYTLATPQTLTVVHPLTPLGGLATTIYGASPANTWTWRGAGIMGPGSSSPAQNIALVPHNGATLASVTMYFAVSSPHTGALPSSYPKINIYRVKAQTGVSPPNLVAATDDLDGTSFGQSLVSGGFTAFPAPANLTAYVASSQVQSWTATCNQNNVIDTSQYQYIVEIRDENGATYGGTINDSNTMSHFNVFFYLALSYTGINDLRFSF
jgi:hypothetical protein